MQKRTLLSSPAHKRSGFTLLELLIVLAIILVFAGAASGLAQRLHFAR